jgi:hypothetical protein
MEKWNSCSKPPTSSWKSVRSRLDLDRFCGDLRFEQTWGTGYTQNSTRLKRSNLHNLQRFSPTFVRQKPKSPMVTLHVKSQVSECHDKSWTAKSKRKTSWSNVRFVNYRVVHPYTPSYFHWFIDLCSLHSVVRYSPPKKNKRGVETRKVLPAASWTNPSYWPRRPLTAMHSMVAFVSATIGWRVRGGSPSGTPRMNPWKSSMACCMACWKISQHMGIFSVTSMRGFLPVMFDYQMVSHFIRVFS